ncbi:DinB family protein [Actinophytocola sp.]|uniref:DinB family protein n=1 Tax=Actinophytocola sp. TaxID=1872138 RepID=UPI003D6C57BB
MDANARPVADERDGLLTFLAQQRRVLKIAAHGLTEEQLRLVPSASALSVGGLLKHVAHTERGWTDRIGSKPRTGSVEEYGAEFRMTPDDSLESLLAAYDRVAAHTEEVVAGVADLGQAVPVPDEPWFSKDVEAWSVRWILLHLIEETARHAGHADIVRESIDGATGYELLAAAEGWEPTPWLKPWEPVGSA